MGFPVQLCVAGVLPKLLLITAIISISSLGRSFLRWLFGDSRFCEADGDERNNSGCYPFLANIISYPTYANTYNDQYPIASFNQPVYAHDNGDDDDEEEEEDDPCLRRASMAALKRAYPGDMGMPSSHADMSLHTIEKLHADDHALLRALSKQKRGFCCVCLCHVDLFTENKSRLTGCGHEFHVSCLNNWLRACGHVKACPLCRTPT